MNQPILSRRNPLIKYASAGAICQIIAWYPAGYAKRKQQKVKNNLALYAQKYGNNASFWSLADQMVVSGGNFTLGLWLAHWLGLGAFGQFSLWYLSTLFVLGIHQALIGQAFQGLWPGKPTHERPAYGRALWKIQVLATSALVLLGGVFCTLSALNGCNMVLTAIALGLLLGWHDFLRKYCFAIQRYRLPLLADLALLGSLWVGLAFMAWLGHQQAADVLMLYVFLYGTAGLGFAAHLGLFAPGEGARMWLTTIKNHYHFSFWLLGAALLQWLAGNSFLLAAAAWLGAPALGGLRVAQQLVGLSHVLFQALENTMPAAASQYFNEQGIAAMWRYLSQMTLQMARPMAVFLLTLALGGALFSNWLLGPEAAEYSWLIAAYAGLYVGVFLAIPARIALRATGQSHVIFVAYAVSAVLGLSLAYPLARHAGIWGTMAGLYASQLVSLALYAFALKAYTYTSRTPR